MRKRLLIIVSALALGLASQAQALTLTNRDDAEWPVTIQEGNELRTIELRAFETVEIDCLNGCSLSVDEDEPMSFDGYESVYIEDGEIVVAQ